MTLAPRPRSTAAALLRVLAGWLAVLLLVQGFAAAQALGLGPLHRHGGDAASHAHHHATGERHHHVGDASSAGASAQADALDVDLAALALTAALALLALGQRLAPVDRRRHVWRPASAWAALGIDPILPRRPPRGC
jgi:hypothetical protein